MWPSVPPVCIYRVLKVTLRESSKVDLFHEMVERLPFYKEFGIGSAFRRWVAIFKSWLNMLFTKMFTKVNMLLTKDRKWWWGDIEATMALHVFSVIARKEEGKRFQSQDWHFKISIQSVSVCTLRKDLGIMQHTTYMHFTFMSTAHCLKSTRIWGLEVA